MLRNDSGAAGVAVTMVGTESIMVAGIAVDGTIVVGGDVVARIGIAVVTGIVSSSAMAAVWHISLKLFLSMSSFLCLFAILR